MAERVCRGLLGLSRAAGPVCARMHVCVCVCVSVCVRVRLCVSGGGGSRGHEPPTVFCEQVQTGEANGADSSPRLRPRAGSGMLLTQLRRPGERASPPGLGPRCPASGVPHCSVHSGLSGAVACDSVQTLPLCGAPRFPAPVTVARGSLPLKGGSRRRSASVTLQEAGRRPSVSSVLLSPSPRRVGPQGGEPSGRGTRHPPPPDLAEAARGQEFI